jgi:hypothetical protein
MRWTALQDNYPHEPHTIERKPLLVALGAAPRVRPTKARARNRTRYAT